MPITMKNAQTPLSFSISMDRESFQKHLRDRLDTEKETLPESVRADRGTGFGLRIAR